MPIRILTLAGGAIDRGCALRHLAQRLHRGEF